MTHTSNPADELRRLIAEGRISHEALHAITGISPAALATFLREAPSGTPVISTWSSPLSSDESGRLNILASQLAEGFQIDDDVRLRAIFEGLTIDCKLTLENIAQLTGIDMDDLAAALDDPRSIPTEKKYALAIKGSYFINAVNQARRN